MFHYPMLVNLVLLLCCGGVRGAEGPQKTGEQDVWRKSLPNNREIVVVRGPEVSPQFLGGLVGEQFEAEASTVYTIRVELRTSGQPTLLLTSRIVSEGRQASDKGFDVLDAMVERGQITLAIAQFADIGLWRIGLTREPLSAMAWLKSADWSPWAAAHPRDRNNVKVTLSRSQDGKLTAEVADLFGGRDRFPHARFVQKADEWEFSPVKQWQEKALATHPATSPAMVPQIPKPGSALWPDLAWVTLPKAEEIREVKVQQPGLNLRADEPVLTAARARELLAAAKPIDPADPEIHRRAYASWYNGSFTTDRGMYRYQLFLGGYGLLTTPEGKYGLFAYTSHASKPGAAGK